MKGTKRDTGECFKNASHSYSQQNCGHVVEDSSHVYRNAHQNTLHSRTAVSPAN